MEKKSYRKHIRFTYKEAKKLTSVRHSCVVDVAHEMTLPMPHMFVTNIRVGLKEALDKLLLTYNTELRGVPLAYNNIKVVSSKIIDDLEVFKMDIKLSIIVFKPEPGKLLNGTVNKITSSHFGCIIHTCINGSVRQPHRNVLSNEQKDVVDNIAVGDIITFKVWKFDMHHGIIIVFGDIMAQCYQRIRRNSQSCSESEEIEPITKMNKTKEESSSSDGDLEDHCVGKSNEDNTDVNVLQQDHIVEKSSKKKKKKDSSLPKISTPKKNISTLSPEKNWKEIEVKKEVTSSSDDDLEDHCVGNINGNKTIESFEHNTDVLHNYIETSVKKISEFSLRDSEENISQLNQVVEKSPKKKKKKDNSLSKITSPKKNKSPDESWKEIKVKKEVTSNSDDDLEGRCPGKSNGSKPKEPFDYVPDVLHNSIETSVKKTSECFSHDDDSQQNHIVKKSPKKKRKKDSSLSKITSPKKNVSTSSPENCWKEIQVKKEVTTPPEKKSEGS